MHLSVRFYFLACVTAHATICSLPQGSEFGETIKKRAFGSMGAASAKGEKRRTSLSALAVLEAEGEGLRHEDHFDANLKDTAYSRLKVLFPKAPEKVLRDMIVLSPHEEAAVARLLVLGYAMWCVTDYKLLRFAAKKLKNHRVERGMTQKWGARHHQNRSKHGGRPGAGAALKPHR